MIIYFQASNLNAENPASCLFRFEGTFGSSGRCGEKCSDCADGLMYVPFQVF